MSMSAVPPQIDHTGVQVYLAGLDGVASLHDLHIWPMSTTEIALTAHLCMPTGHPGDAFLTETAHELSHKFGIVHATIQIETSAQPACALAPDHVV
jgi:cobalt-zinc-cadmium efflux system protein